MTDKEIIVWKVKIGLGDEGLRFLSSIGVPYTTFLDASSLSDSDQKDPTKVWKLFENQMKVTVNFRIACTQAQMCEFSDAEMQDRIIELVIAGTRMEVFR